LLGGQFAANQLAVIQVAVAQPNYILEFPRRRRRELTGAG